MADMKMRMTLSFMDKASPQLRKLERNIDRVKRKMDDLNRKASGTNQRRGGGIAGAVAGGAVGSRIGQATPGGTSGGGGGASTAIASAGAALGISAERGKAFNRAMEAASQRMQVLKTQAEGLRSNIAAFNGVTFQGTSMVDKYQKQLSRVDTEMSQLDDQLKRVGSTFGKTTAFVGAVATTLVALAGAAVVTGKRMEKLKASLSSVIPPTTNTADAFALILRITEKLPTNIDQTAQAFTKMLALGIAPTEERMVSFGNTAAAMGKDILQFVEAVADAATGEFERLKEFGIKASVEGDKVALTFQGHTKTIGKNANDIVGYLEDIGNVQFAGAAAKQMDTLDGKISNLGVAWDKFVTNIYEGGIDQAVKWFVDLTSDGINWLNKEWILFLNNIVSVIGGIDKLGAKVVWLKDRFKAAAGLMTFEETDAIYERRAAIIDSTVKAMHEQNNALLDTDAAANRANAAMKKLDEKQKKVALGAVVISDGYNAMSEEEFFRNLVDGAQDFADQQDFALNSFEKLDKMFQRGVISQEAYTEANRVLNEQLGMDAQETAEEVEGWWQQAANNMQDTMGDVFFDWMQGKMTDLGDAFKTMIDRMVAELIASNLMNFLLGDFGSTGTVGGLVGNIFRAEGGPVTGNQPYIVGERGPELFVPNSSGNIVANKDMGSMGGNTISMSFQSLDPQENFRIFEQNARRIAELVNATNTTYNLRTA